MSIVFALLLGIFATTMFYFSGQDWFVQFMSQTLNPLFSWIPSLPQGVLTFLNEGKNWIEWFLGAGVLYTSLRVWVIGILVLLMWQFMKLITSLVGRVGSMLAGGGGV